MQAAGLFVRRTLAAAAVRGKGGCTERHTLCMLCVLRGGEWPEVEAAPVRGAAVDDDDLCRHRLQCL